MTEQSSEKRQNLLYSLTQEYKRRLLEYDQYNWRRHARPKQNLPLGDWRVWLILAGRGFGKTRTGAETIREWVTQGVYKRISLISQNLQEARDVMVEGESGLLSVHPKKERPLFESSKRRLTWPNGAIATLFGADHYEKLRGPQFDAAWIDELAKFRHPQEVWDQLMLGLRLGTQPRCLVTTTPRPIPLIEKLLKDPSTVFTHGTTFENKKNLAPPFLEQILRQFEGTQVGAQELYAELLTEKKGALWKRTMIRYQTEESLEWDRIVVAIDPAITNDDQSDETGMIVASLAKGGKAYILDDLSGRYSPAEWGRKAIEAYWNYRADRVVAEVNQGGDLVERILRSFDSCVSYRSVRATRTKAARAEPIASLYEQGKVFHIRPFQELEKQLCDFVPGKALPSPDRLDALVWALTDLLIDRGKVPLPKIWV